MTTTADAAEKRKVRSIARRYERDGYRVTMPGSERHVPAFLEGIRPDLIAESEHDRVVVEVKRSDAVRGANDLLETAERVAAAPGWRFELVTVAAQDQVLLPTGKRLDAIERQARDLTSAGHPGIAYAWLSTMLEELLGELAAARGLKVEKAPFERLLRDLASKGVLSREHVATAKRARAFRNRLLHSEREPAPEPDDIKAQIALLSALRDELPSRRASAASAYP